jgi:hypothetical protein
MSNTSFIPPISSLHRYLIEARESVLAGKIEDEKVVSITPEHRSYSTNDDHAGIAANKKV